jgi:hypothetical protein
VGPQKTKTPTASTTDTVANNMAFSRFVSSMTEKKKERKEKYE